MTEAQSIYTKHEVAKAIAEELKGETDKRITIVDIKKIFELLPAIMVKMVGAGKTVRFQGLCDFEPVIVEEHSARNPKTGEEITVPTTRRVRIRKSNAFAKKVKATYND